MTGLTSAEALARLQQDGPNEVEKSEGPSRWELLKRQLNNPFVWMLLGACGVAGALGEVVDAIAIGVIVGLNTLVGYLQENRAERALSALRAMTAPRARVLRDGASRMIPAQEVVVGDVLVLEAGDVVAADAQLLTTHALTTNEAALTGESMPSSKKAEPVGPEVPLAERQDHVWAGTTVSTGTAKAQVVATGMRSEIGKIAAMLGTAHRGETPLQRRLRKVSRDLLVVCLGVVAVVAVLGLLRGASWLEILLGSVSLAVAAVPEGLPAVVTIALAVGVQRMASRHVLVRQLPAVETLGCTTVICTDKTGTLTTGEMRVRDVWARDRDQCIKVAVACCDAELDEHGNGVGDPTEVALLIEGRDRGMERHRIEADNPRVSERPFDADRKMMSVFRHDGVLYVKGALSSLLPLCTEGTDAASDIEAEMAARGLRVLAVATGQQAEETALTLVGLVGIADPPRPEAVAAVAAARKAGIRPVMITGDHAVTAQAIAKELGVLADGEDAAEVVHARVTPQDKIDIVRKWKDRGEIVVMTGDGVNDAPAVREAHVGIAMGQTGTEVTREAASFILTDDNFASIVAGIAEGRTVFDNIRKTIVYLLTGNAAELMVMFGAALLGLPAPLLPVQILWVNLVTDGLPALALVMDPPDRDVLASPPRDPNETMLGRPQWRDIGIRGSLEATVVLFAYLWALREGDQLLARTVAFDTLVASEILRAFAARSPVRTFWGVGAFSNLKLLLVIAISAGMQVALHFIPGVSTLFHLVPISLKTGAVVVGLGLIPVSVMEVVKLLGSQRRT